MFSLLFYAWGEPILVFVMVFSIIFNYLFGLCLFKNLNSPRVKFYLLIGILSNLILLIYYKYLYFFATFINKIASAFRIPESVQVNNIPLLLGVSFFSFQAISYLIDIYRRVYPAQKNILKFALFKTLFPQLIAGPIVRYAECGYQIDSRHHSVKMLAAGIEQFIIGLAKKVLIADVCAVSVDKMFAIPVSEMTGSIAWIATFLFSLQIYFDFSGYTDMALGLGKMFGFKLPENFNYPYTATSIQDFWRRWHMTLSRWFRDYLYIPLGGNRKGPVRTVFNLFIVFALCGLWHGANITFLIWGLLHGFFLSVERTGFGRYLERWPKFVRHLYVLLVVLLSWMIFRANSVEQIIGISKAMFGANGWHNPLYGLRLYADNLTWCSAVFGLVFSLPIVKYLNPKNEILVWKLIQTNSIAIPIVRVSILCTLFLVCIAFIGAQTHHAFIYFRF